MVVNVLSVLSCSSYQVLQQRIQDCLGLAVSLNLNSIAFPTVGCGNLRYPVDKVARRFKTAVAATNNLRVKHFVINPGDSSCVDQILLKSKA